jgi:putative heme-binding domain-containing protein
MRHSKVAQPRAVSSIAVVLFVLFAALASPSVIAAPLWIWVDSKESTANDVRVFRKSFVLASDPKRAVLYASGDDQARVFLNGQQSGSSSAWNKPIQSDVTSRLHSGTNLIAVRVKNDGGAAGLVLRLDITLEGGKKESISTDTSWRASTETPGWQTPEFSDASWAPVVRIADLGDEPWGNVFAARQATAADSLQVAPGFKVELLRSAEPGEGSWVCMTVDSRGRLIISPQEGTRNLLRVTLGRGGKIEKIETIDAPVGSAMGLLYTENSLYLSGNGPDGLGLYRLRDTKGNGSFDEVKTLKKWDGGGGEHGAHGIVRGPDNKLYIVNGNFAKVPQPISPNSPHRNYQEDQLLPRGEDGNGFGIGIKPPGGQVLRTDLEGREWELFAAGFRNTYDIAFNEDGELFGFDSDMEWDWGMPWYRPIRVNHIVSGGDYGFREGSGKWPEYYPDSLPSTVNIGIGSPTGVRFGTGSNFPEKYRRAFYIMDWSYGRILAVHLDAKGSTYGGSFETFVRGKPLNVTDLEIGRDGAMYFLTGGRGTQSGLYRVSKVDGAAPGGERTVPDRESTKAREIRRSMEKLHGHADAASLDSIWTQLDSPDRWIRYAARIALESQDVALWRQRAVSETRTNAAITALLALARVGPKESQPEILKALTRFPLDNLTEAQKLEKLRVIELSFIRQGKPAEDLAQLGIEKLNRQYPSTSAEMNRELCQLLVYLQAPEVVAKTLGLLEKASTQEERLLYLFHLRTLKSGWTAEQHREYFNWLNQDFKTMDHPAATVQWFRDVGIEFQQGASFPKFIAYFRKDAVASLSDSERGELAPYITGQKQVAKTIVKTRSFVKSWTAEDLVPALSQLGRGRSFETGKEVYTAAQCAACHRFNGDGGAIGPDLTTISSRFSARDILDSIVDPSKVVSEQYQNSSIHLKNGDDLTGRVIEETGDKLTVLLNALTGDKTSVPKAAVEKREPSPLSPMPNGLVDTMNREEILDLIAYLQSAGNPSGPAFRK